MQPSCFAPRRDSGTLPLLALGLILGLVLWGAPARAAGPEATPLRVTASIGPLGFLASAVAGDRAEVVTLLPRGKCPETFRPGPADLERLAGARLFFVAGATFEQPWSEALKKVDNPPRTVDTAAGIAEIGGEGGAARRAKGLVGIWLDPNQARRMARRMAEALEGLDPAGKAAYQANLAALDTRLTNLDTRLRELFQGFGRRNAFVSDRPDWAWLAAAYGLEMMPAAGFTGEPDTARLKALWLKARQRGVGVLVVRESCGALAARTLALQLRAQVVPADPFAADYEDNLLQAARRIRAALR